MCNFREVIRKRRYLPACSNTVLVFVQCLNENERKAPSTIRTCLPAIAERHEACRYPDPTSDYLFIEPIKGVARSHPQVDQCHHLSSRELSLIIKSVPLLKCSSYKNVLLRAMFSLMLFGFLRVGVVTASPPNLSVSQCRIKPSMLRLVFRS